MSNESALFRSLLAYGICLPLAVFLGYLLATPLDFTTVGVVGGVVFVLAIPLLLRWHHFWLVAAWNASAVIFLLPGKPPVWMALAALSFGVSILQYTLNRNLKFLSVPSVARPLLLLTGVVLITMEFTGGFGLRSAGSGTSGGRFYVEFLVAVVGYFAIINRRIPSQRIGLYVACFFLGGATILIADLPGKVNPAFNFLFLFFPVTSPLAFLQEKDVIEQTSLVSRGAGLAAAGSAVYVFMLARYGIRGVLDLAKPWRLAVFCTAIPLALSGGYRSTFIVFTMTFAVLFYLERLHHTRWLLVAIAMLLAGGGLTVLFASRMPLSIQRSLAVVPFIPIDPLARMDAETTSEWRIELWRQLVPQIPQYLLLGKGYAFSRAEQAQVRIGGGYRDTEMVANYHNGPLSVILPFGIFGLLAFIWLLVAGLRVLYQNYQFGDPALHNINTLLFASFIVSVIYFFAVYGQFYLEMRSFLGMIALGISLNGGVAKPVVVPQPKIVFNRFKLHPSVRRPAGA
jgi:O-antigen ligase